MLIIDRSERKRAEFIIVDGELAYKVEPWVMKRASREGNQAAIHDWLRNELLSWKRRKVEPIELVSFTLILSRVSKVVPVRKDNSVQIGD
jgi:hypothetical protein